MIARSHVESHGTVLTDLFGEVALIFDIFAFRRDTPSTCAIGLKNNVRKIFLKTINFYGSCTVSPSKYFFMKIFLI